MALETGKYILLNGLIDLFIPQLSGGGGGSSIFAP